MGACHLQVRPENTTATVRQKKEIKWILKLQTAFRYGFYDKIEEKYQRDSDLPIGLSFLSLKRN